MDIFSKFYNKFDQVLTDYVLETAQKIAEAIGPTAWTLFGIYIVLWGFSHIRGQIEEPLTDAAFRLLKIALILGFALNVGLYGEYIVDFALKAPEAFGVQVALGGESTDASSIGSTADKLVNTCLDTAEKIWAEAGVMNGNVGHYFVAIGFVIFGLAMALVAFVLYMLAKAGLIFVLAFGPLFILMAMFQTTKRFFESWINAVVGFMFQIIFILAAVGFTFGTVQKVAERAGKLTAMQQLLEGLTQLTAACGIGIVLLFVAKGMATMLAGGVNASLGDAMHKMSHGSRVAKGAAGIAAAAATGGASAVAAGAKLAANAGHSMVGKMYRATNTIHRGRGGGGTIGG